MIPSRTDKTQFLIRSLMVLVMLASFFALPLAASIVENCEDHCEDECNDCDDCSHCLPTLHLIVLDGSSSVPVSPVTTGAGSAVVTHPDRVFVTGIDRPPQSLLL